MAWKSLPSVTLPDESLLLWQRHPRETSIFLIRDKKYENESILVHVDNYSNYETAVSLLPVRELSQDRSASLDNHWHGGEGQALCHSFVLLV